MNDMITNFPTDVIEDPRPSKEVRKHLLIEYLDKLQREYDEAHKLPEITVPETLGLVDMEVPVLDVEELTKEATNEYSADYVTDVAQMEQRSASKASEIEEDMHELGREHTDSLTALANDVDRRKEAVMERTIDRGVARSSIADSKADALDRYESIERNRMQAIHDLELSRLESELRINEEALREALTNYDIAHAVRIKERVDKLTAEVVKQRESAIKYNNANATKEADYQLRRDKYLKEKLEERKKALLEQEKYEQEHGYTGDKKTNYLKRYNAVKDYLRGTSPKAALDEIKNDPTFREYLGYYYDVLEGELVKQAR